MVQNNTSFIQFARRLARNVSGGTGDLNTKDPDAIQKLMSHVTSQAQEFERQTGAPVQDTFSQLFQTTEEERRGINDFRARNPEVDDAGFSPLEVENLYYEERLRDLGGNPTRIVGFGTGQDAIRSRNEALKREYRTLQAPLRQGGPTLAQEQQTFRSPEETPVLRNILPGLMAQGSVDPSSNVGFFTTPLAAIQAAVTPPVGLSDVEFEALPGPLQPVARAAQTALSPGSILTAGAGSAIGGAHSGRLANLLADRFGVGIGAEFGGNLGSEIAAEQGASLPVQIAAGLAGGVAGGGLTAAGPAAARTARNVDGTAVRRAVDQVSPVGVARAADNSERGLIQSRLDEISLRLEADRGQIHRPRWATGLTDQELRAVARQEGVNPADVDWADGLDPVVIREARSRAYRNPNEPSVTQLAQEARDLRRRLRDLPEEPARVELEHPETPPEIPIEDLRASALRDLSDAELDEVFSAVRRVTFKGEVAPTGRVRPSAAQAVTETQRRTAHQRPETPASTIDNALADLEAEIAQARLRLSGSGGTPPPRAPGTPIMGGDDVPPPRSPHTALADDLELPSHEKPRQGIFRKWSGARNVERLSIEGWFRRGQNLLKTAGVRNINQRTDDLEVLFKALHGDIDPAVLKPALRPVYDDLRRLIAQETEDMTQFLQAAKEANPALFGLDADNFISTMMAHPDYFPRGWKLPKFQPGTAAGRVGTRPGFTRPRVDATFTELLESGLEPASWDPYAMMARRRLAGVEYRETITLIHRLKQRGMLIDAANAPEGWRVPKVGPAFEGRPVGTDDAGNIIYSKKLAVPNNRREGFVARELEGLFGSGEDISHLDWLRKISNSLKRMKLIGSAFQHIDITTRALGAGFAPSVHSIKRGSALKTPAMVTELFKLQWWPAARRQFRQDLLSRKSWYNDFDINSRMLIEEGWNVQGDLSVINREFTDFIDGATRDLPRALKGIKQANDFWEQGLFEGVYAGAQRFALREHLIPAIRRAHPDWTPRQVAAQAAENVNIMFSSQDKWQTVFRLAGPEMREFTRAMIFSTNESEGLIKGAIRAMNPRSPHFKQFAEWYVGTAIALAGIANLIHYTATGKVLPKEAYNPVNPDDPYAPFGVGYDSQFLSPEMPFVRGRNDTPIMMDLVGQMDTAFRWALDPMSALSARTNVLPRAIQNQLGSGTNFHGEPLQTPGQRVGQAALDLGAPIGVQSAVGAASEEFPVLQHAFPAAEQRLGTAGQLLQTSGVNFRSLRNEQLRQLAEQQPELAQSIEAELERRQVEDILRYGDIRSTFTSTLERRLEQARELNEAFVVRAIEAELARRGEDAPATPTGGAPSRFVPVQR